MASEGRADTVWRWPAEQQPDLGEERPVPQLGDDDALDRGPELVEQVAHQVVGHRSRGDHALQGVGDGRCLGGPDVDRQRPVGAGGLLQQQDRGVGRKFDPHRSEVHLHHAVR